MSLKTEDKISKLKEQLARLEIQLKKEKESSNSGWLKIPELKIEVEIEVHDKNKSWNELKLSERESELLTAEQCIFLANSKYASQLKMNGSSSDDDFFIQHLFNLNKKNNYVARFVADSGGAYLFCNWLPVCSLPSLGVRFCRKLGSSKCH